MINGFNTAAGEVTLVLFTTLAPAGAVAVAVMALVLLFAPLDEAVRRLVNKCLCIPLVVAMLGLVASATHLGNPSNALYVFLGVGRSPLSTEVFCAVLFLLMAGVYWLYSFAVSPRRVLLRALLVFQVLAAAAFVTAVAFAYAAETVPTWTLPTVPVALWLNALAAGPLLALVSLTVAHWPAASGRFGRVMLAVSGAASVAAVAVYAFQGFALSGVENAIVSAADLVPGYGAMLLAFALCSAGGLAVFAFSLRASKLGEVSKARPIVSRSLASALVLAGVFVMRFAFYMMHLTVGLGV